MSLRMLNRPLDAPPTVDADAGGDRRPDDEAPMASTTAGGHSRPGPTGPAEIAPPLPFADRTEAGRALARRLAAADLPEPRVVLALPRGGVPVAAEVARALHAPLDLLLVRKIGAPDQPELAVAALADGTPPRLVIDERACRLAGVDRDDLDERARQASAEIARRRLRYLGDRARVAVAGTTAIVIDDGLATGTTARAALAALRDLGPARRILAVPVGAAESVAALRAECDAVVCLAEPVPFLAIGLHYRDFHQVGDDEVLAALGAAGSGG